MYFDWLLILGKKTNHFETVEKSGQPYWTYKLIQAEGLEMKRWLEELIKPGEPQAR